MSTEQVVDDAAVEVPDFTCEYNCGCGEPCILTVKHLATGEDLQHACDNHFPDARPVDDVPAREVENTLETRLRALLNSESAESESDTPDFILSQYMIGCLENFNAAVNRRDRWFGRGSPWGSNGKDQV